MCDKPIALVGDNFIAKSDSKMLKGVAILMMVSMHLMKTEWIDNPNFLIDITIGSENLSHILAESFHASSAIFAFISGYVWGGITKKRNHGNEYCLCTLIIG